MAIEFLPFQGQKQIAGFNLPRISLHSKHSSFLGSLEDQRSLSRIEHFVSLKSCHVRWSKLPGTHLSMDRLPGFFTIIKMNFLSAKNLVVFMPLPCYQQQISVLGF